MPPISILICTRNHADALAHTLVSIARTRPSHGLDTELIVVANACTDGTEQLVRQTRIPHMAVRFVDEPKKGKGNAYAAGLKAASGSVILFTDDDVRVPANWLGEMTAPILAGTADAVAGGVKMAPHLERPWMQPMHRVMQAETATLDPKNPEYLVGANMAVARPILDAVGGFDLELGPGGLGYAEDYLLGLQLRKRGHRITTRFDVVVEHHFDVSRLRRESWLAVAEKQGRSTAYLAHHWEHREITACGPRAALRALRLLLWRVTHPHRLTLAEGCDTHELMYLRSVVFYRAYMNERRRPRNYSL